MTWSEIALLLIAAAQVVRVGVFAIEAVLNSRRMKKLFEAQMTLFEQQERGMAMTQENAAKLMGAMQPPREPWQEGGTSQ